MVLDCPFRVSASPEPVQGNLGAKAVPTPLTLAWAHRNSGRNGPGSSFQGCYGKKEKKASSDQLLLNLTSPAEQCLLMDDLY